MSEFLSCQHLRSIEASARADGIAIVTTGDWWGNGHANCLYLDCVLAKTIIERLFALPNFVEWYEYDGRVAGHEAGFRCKQCDSLLIGGVAAYGGKLWPAQ